MPSQGVAFDQLLTSIEADYVEPADYNKDEIRGWCNDIPAENRGTFEIGYEMDAHGLGNRILTQITYIPPSAEGEVWFTTVYRVEDILSAPPPWDEEAEDEDLQAQDEVAPEPPPWPAELDTGGHRRTRAGVPSELAPEPHLSQLAAQSQAMAQRGVGAPTGPAPATLLDAIVIPAWWNAYLDYARTNYLMEHALFVADLGGYMNAPTWANFDRMVNLYIRVGSTREINIQGVYRVELIRISDQTTPAQREQQQPGPGANVFDSAYAEVYSDMLVGDYAKFRALYP